MCVFVMLMYVVLLMIVIGCVFFVLIEFVLGLVCVLLEFFFE